jgi:Cys-tRNA synthase (O-phospho-L-seryl-tRNA:Cys-tRNA synthase)
VKNLEWGKFKNFKLSDLCNAKKAAALDRKYFGRLGPFLDYSVCFFIDYDFRLDTEKDYTTDVYFNLPYYLGRDESRVTQEIRNGFRRILRKVEETNFFLPADDYAREYTGIVISRKAPDAILNALVILHLVDDLMGAFNSNNSY